MLSEELRRAQRDPLLGRVPRQVVLREIRPVDGRRGIGADQSETAAIAFAAERFRGGVARGAGADDHDALRRFDPERSRLPLGLAGTDAHVPALRLDLVARDRIQRRRAHSRARAQVEARVVPRAADRAVDEKTFA